MRRLCLTVCLSLTAVNVFAETIARQSYRVSIPKRLSITAPILAPQVEMAQDGTRASFPEQSWNVAANTAAGATVQFTTVHSFENQGDTSIRRDASLEVTVRNQSHEENWVATKSSATTDYLTGQEDATVEIRSTRPGSAAIGLKVTMLAPESYTPQGDYVTTIVGTISEN